MKRLALSYCLVLAGVLIAACGDDEPPPVTAANPPVPVTPVVGTATQSTAKTEPPKKSGVDQAAMDTSVDPCDDFYSYACGNWVKNTEIPGDEASWFRSFSVIRERNEDILHGILDAFSKGQGQDQPYAKALGDFYASCTDEAGIDAQGTKPIQPWVAQIDAIKDPKSLTTYLGKLQADGMPVVFELSASQDFADATQVVGMIWQGGLGMPEKEYYLENSPKMTELRGKYESHVGSMLILGGDADAKAKAEAKTVMAVETQLAKAWMSKEDRREPKKINHRATRAELAKVAPGFDWDDWLAGAGAKDVGTFNVSQPDFVKALGAMIAGKVSVADWKTYLKWHLLRDTGDMLGARFVDEKFRWRQALVGAKSQPPRWKRCVRAIDGAMGEALGEAFVKKTLGAEGKTTVVGMVKQIEDAMRTNLQSVVWMDDPTKTAAFGKLAKVANKMAYPDKWRDYSGLTIVKDSYLGNVDAAAAFEYRRQLAKIGKPVDRGEWQMSPPTVNAYYDAQLNEMVFPAGILQPPFYANSVPSSTNFGGIGMVMGHELTHGFDDEGRQFDADGNLKDWWSDKVNKEFERRAECVKKQFDDYVVLGDLHVNGKLTLGENIADLGGVKLSYAAYEATQAKGADPEGAKEFFLGFAQAWCGKIRDEALRHQVSTNPHSPGPLRVNGPLSNTPAFAQTYGCKAGSKMVRADRCEVW